MVHKSNAQPFKQQVWTIEIQDNTFQEEKIIQGVIAILVSQNQLQYIIQFLGTALSNRKQYILIFVG
jgi:hypothetical protein